MRKKTKKSVLTCLLIAAFTAANAQQITFIMSNYIDQLRKNTSDTTYVINFWATWCKPCVAEMPAFEKLNAQYKGSKVKVLLVSNDLKKQVNSHLKPFIAKNKIKSTVLFMAETNAGKWIDRVDTEWSGVIPATLIINTKKHFTWFREGELTFEELESTIKPLTEK